MSIQKLTDLSIKYNCNDVAKIVIEDEKFSIWSGSSKPNLHHYGKGGLLKHTTEVVELCLLNNNFLNQMGKGTDDRELFLAALFHDIGKCWDYEPTNSDMSEWQGTVHKRRIHHISRSALVWNFNSFYFKLDNDISDNVLHAILAHHGQRAWGSPVAPATTTAWLLHLCDGISARSEDCERIESLYNEKH